MSLYPRSSRAFGRRGFSVPTPDEVIAQLDRSLEVLRRANDGLEQLISLKPFPYVRPKS